MLKANTVCITFNNFYRMKATTSITTKRVEVLNYKQADLNFASHHNCFKCRQTSRLARHYKNCKEAMVHKIQQCIVDTLYTPVGGGGSMGLPLGSRMVEIDQDRLARFQ